MSVFKREILEEIEKKEKMAKSHTIMVVEDNNEGRKSLISMLSEQYEVKGAKDGQEAMDIIQKLKHPEKISLIISDVNLPGINGIELLEKVENILPHSIKIILSAHDHLNPVFNSINKAKIHKIIQKPFTPEEFMLTIRQAIETFELQSQSPGGRDGSIRILLAEDDRTFGESLKKLLVQNNYEVEWVETYSQLLHPTRDFSKYHILILDLVLGEVGNVGSGIETIGSVKKRMPTLPILVLTSHATVELSGEAFKLGVSEFIEKPLRVSQEFFNVKLKDAINQAIKTFEKLNLDQYESMLSSLKEDELIDRIILPLLRSMGFSHVRRIEHHGPGELGKDILPFFKFDDFLQKVFYAAQVKTGNLTARNLNPVLTQAQTALTVSFTDRYDNTRKRLDKVVIIFSGRMTADATRILEDKLEIDSRIIFIDIVRLLDLLSKHNLLGHLKQQQATEKVVLIPCLLKKKDNNSHFGKKEVLAEIAEAICYTINEKPKNILKLLLEREELASTGVGDSIAFPHTYIASHSPYFVMICYSDFPINWDSSDGKPVHIFALSLYPDRTPLVRLRIQTKLNKVFAEYKSKINEHTESRDQLIHEITDQLSSILKDKQRIVEIKQTNTIEL